MARSSTTLQIYSARVQYCIQSDLNTVLYIILFATRKKKLTNKQQQQQQHININISKLNWIETEL